MLPQANEGLPFCGITGSNKPGPAGSSPQTNAVQGSQRTPPALIWIGCKGINGVQTPVEFDATARCDLCEANLLLLEAAYSEAILPAVLLDGLGLIQQESVCPQAGVGGRVFDGQHDLPEQNRDLHFDS